MKYWLLETVYRNAQDELCDRVRIYRCEDWRTANMAVPDNEHVRRIEEIFEDDVELFDCEVVK